MAASEVQLLFSKKFGEKTGQQQLPDSAEKKYLLPRKSRSSHCRCSVKEELQGLQCFPVNIAKFLRTLILKNICERLFLKINISVTNLLKGGNS